MMNVAPYECYSDLARIFEGMIVNPIVLGINAPWLSFPPSGQSYDEQESIPIPGVGNLFVPVLEIDVPIGFDGVINKYQCNFTGGGFIDGSGDLVWQLQVNGKAIRNYDNILTERGDPNLPRDCSAIRIYSGNVVQFLVQHPSNPLLANGYIICGLSGYFYPNL